MTTVPMEPNRAIWFNPPPRSTKVPVAPPRAERKQVPLTVDGEAVEVELGSTVLDACRALGKSVPTLCYLETLTPVNACRICVVEQEGARVLVPACSRKAEEGMRIKTRSPRVDLARKIVLELLGSSVDLSTAPGLAEMMVEYGAQPDRFGAHGAAGAAGGVATVAQPTKIDNDLYVRDYSKCILCYKCVEACGEDAQNTFAIAVAGRGFDARISTEQAVPLPQSACVYCGNCIGVCPTGALMAKTEYDMREAGTWDPAQQTVTETICPYCGVGCAVELHVQDERILKVTSPLDSTVTDGHLCIKGRFGFEFVNERPKG
jgi:predicted molibdopterin-dependent oxidoreductase YjgC